MHRWGRHYLVSAHEDRANKRHSKTHNKVQTEYFIKRVQFRHDLKYRYNFIFALRLLRERWKSVKTC